MQIMSLQRFAKMKMQVGLSHGYRGDDVIVVIERCKWIQVDQHQLVL
jgi:hypothetical protein